MRLLLVGMILSLSGCALFLDHVRPARFVDGSDVLIEQKRPSAYICVPDSDTRNPGGVMCGEEGAIRDVQKRLQLVPDNTTEM